MKISDILEMSLTNLWRRKTRTVLTVLGVIIGTASIVVMLSLGIGLKQAMLAEVGTAGGLTEIMVYSDGEGGVDELLLGDDTVDKFKELDHVENVEPQLWYSMPIQVGKYENYITLVGVSPEYMSKIELEEGEIPKKSGMLSMVVGNQVIGDFFDYTTGEYPYYESDEVPNVDLLHTPMVGGLEEEEYSPEDSSTDNFTDSENNDSGTFDSAFSVSADTSGDSDSKEDDESTNDFSSDDSMDFSTEDPFADAGDMSIGDFDDFGDDSMSYSSFSSSMKRVPMQVSGVTAGDIESYTEYSYNCYTDLDSLKDFLKKNYSENSIIPGQPTDKQGKPFRDLKYSQITINVDESENVEDVLQTVQDMGYRADANKEWLEEVEKQFMIIEAVLGGIGGVAMLVAAISIANTMTMSTYERTKEIGIMKVLGCSLANIRSMFLAEAAFIGFLGGVAGVGLSFLLSTIVNHFAPALVESEMSLASGASISQIPFWLVVVSILFATIIGMLAGFFPAQRATKLSPLAAIRNE